eukprot:COSAG03_NODE_2044_length_3189_cov_7.890327_2_plen_223_part_00
MRRETGGSSHRSDASNLPCLRPLNHGLSCFCCVYAVQEGDVPEFRRHRLAGKQADLDVFSEVCGHFYVAAGRWAAKRRLGELKVGGAVLTNCISCHNHHHSPVQAATSPDLGSILAVSQRCSKRCQKTDTQTQTDRYTDTERERMEHKWELVESSRTPVCRWATARCAPVSCVLAATSHSHLLSPVAEKARFSSWRRHSRALATAWHEARRMASAPVLMPGA